MFGRKKAVVAAGEPLEDAMPLAASDSVPQDIRRRACKIGFLTTEEEMDARDIITAVAIGLGVNDPNDHLRAMLDPEGPRYVTHGYGSFWWIEFPRMVALRNRVSREAAVAYATEAFITGDLKLPYH